MYLKVWNKCLKCDTTLYREVNIVQFPGATVSSTINALNCKKYKFELSYIKGFFSKRHLYGLLLDVLFRTLDG